jgi:hypothetical protein
MTQIRSKPQPRAAPRDESAAEVGAKTGLLGRNLSRRELFAWIDREAASNDLPPEVLRAIALQESSGLQWNGKGQVVTHVDRDSTDWGVMQINDSHHGVPGTDLQRVKSDERYNIEVGARKLRLAGDYWFQKEHGHRFSMSWYNDLSPAAQRAARIDLFRAYNGWLKGSISNALPYERRIANGEARKR